MGRFFFCSVPEKLSALAPKIFGRAGNSAALLCRRAFRYKLLLILHKRIFAAIPHANPQIIS